MAGGFTLGMDVIRDALPLSHEGFSKGKIAFSPDSQESGGTFAFLG